MPGVALLNLLTSLISIAIPDVTAIVSAWLKRYRSEVEDAIPEAYHDIEAAIGGDPHALSVLYVRLYEKVGPNAPGQPGDASQYQDRVSDGGQSMAGGAPPAVPSPSQPAR